MLAHIALVEIFGYEEGVKIWEKCNSPEMTMIKGLPIIDGFSFREYLLEKHKITSNANLKEIVETYYPEHAKKIAKDILYTSF